MQVQEVYSFVLINSTDMDNQNYTTTITVEMAPEKAFEAINNVSAWWSGEIEGSTDNVGDIFTYRYKDMHESTQKVVELIPSKKVVWKVLKSNISFLEHKTEWDNTEIVFEISQKDGKTEIQFTHEGLVPQLECYDACSSGWTSLIQDNLRNLIKTGQGQSDAFES
jgi:hypothetical protein